MTSWRMGNLRLDWFCEERGVPKYGMIWADNPLHLSATIRLLENGQYRISEQGLHGLSNQERECLKKHLGNFGFHSKPCQ